METASRIVAVVGLSGVGKSQVVAYLSDRLACGIVYFGGIVLDEMARRGLQKTPENERVVREAIRAEHGMGAMAILAKDQIKTQIAKGSSVVIDGLYSDEELSVLRHAFGDGLVLLAVHSDRRVRAKRLQDRKERALSLAQMLERDASEIANLNKAKPIVTAEYHIVNNGSLAALYEAIDRLPMISEG